MSLENDIAPTHLPTEQQIALFGTMEDIHELTGAIAVLLVDDDGKLMAISGDENEVPPSLRGVLSGRRLREAGSVIKLLEPISGDLAGSPVNVTVLAVDGVHVLAILFDAQVDFSTVQVVGREGRDRIAEILASVLD